MSFLGRLFSPTPDPREALRDLWRAVVAMARQPEWYRDGGVADTLEGRFDMICSVLALVLLRMEKTPALAAQTALLTELFVEEMDGQLRQSGIGDLMVGKQIGKLMAALGGRVGAYRDALPRGSEAWLQAVRRNLTFADGGGDGAGDGDRAAAAAEGLRRLALRLAELEETAVLRGEIA